jgi:hypothetical protein
VVRTPALCIGKFEFTEKGRSTYIFVAILVNGQVYCAKRAPPNLVFDEVLVDAVLGGAVVFAVAVFGFGVERLLYGYPRLTVCLLCLLKEGK